MPKYLMPVGNTDFKEIRETGLYYIDKTMLIDQLVNQSAAKVTLFTRPRRFGKSLNMSMLQHFFDIMENNKELFNGLAISKDKDLCENWMNKYPTILVSFKDVGSSNFKSAFELLKSIISKLYESYEYLLDGKLTKRQERLFNSFLMGESSEAGLTDCLYLLTDIMYHKYDNTPVILLIDEYDVPMAKGDANGYYRDITDIMSVMLSKAPKDNPYIKFAVLTGCLRIAKESIFTGLNNPKIYSILDYGYQEYFGFTDSEIDRLLADTGFTEYKKKIKEWYDGYRFGDTEIYCPWDVLNYVSDLQQKAGVEPKDYWANTSGNDILKQFLNSKFNPRSDFEALLNGRYIKKRIVENITYNDLITSEDNLWSVLLMTGYLTVVPEDEAPADDISNNDINGVYLRLVNNEIKELFSTTVSDWFKETVYRNSRDDLFKALWSGDAVTLASIISRYLRSTISFYDYSESFYHAFLAGLFTGYSDISVTPKRKPGSISIKSNREYGEGRADVVIENRVTHTAAVLEFKVADNIVDTPSMCDVALSQIHDIGYAEALQEDEGYDLINYGVIFYKKRCFIKKGNN